MAIFALNNVEQLENLCNEISNITGVQLDMAQNYVAAAVVDKSYAELCSITKNNKTVFFDSFYLCVGLEDSDLVSPAIRDELKKEEDDNSIIRALERICSTEHTYRSIYRVNFHATGLPIGEHDYCMKYENYQNNPENVDGITPLHSYLQEIGVLVDGEQIEHTVSCFTNEVENNDDSVVISNRYGFVFPTYNDTVGDFNVVAECGSLYVKGKNAPYKFNQIDTEREFYIADHDKQSLIVLKIISIDEFEYDGFDRDVEHYNDDDSERLVDYFSICDCLPPISFKESIRHIADKGLRVRARICGDSILDDANQEDIYGFVAEAVINEDSKEIVVSVRTYAELVDHYDYYACQSLIGLENDIHDAYRNTGRYDDYVFKLIGVEHHSICVSDNVSIVVVGNVSFPSTEGDTGYDGVSEQYEQFNTTESFIDAMVEYGVKSVAGNEVLAHDDGNMAGNVFVGFSDGKPDIVFSVLSSFGYSEDYAALKEAFVQRFGDNFRISNVLEYDWSVTMVDPSQDFGWGFLNTVLQLPPKPEFFRLPFLVLPMNIRNPDVNRLNSIDAVDQGLLHSIIPSNSPIPTSKMLLLPPVIVPVKDHVELVREFIDDQEINGIKSIEDPVQLARSLRTVCNNHYYENRKGIFALVVLCDTNDADLVELVLRNMYSFRPEMMISRENLDEIGRGLGIADGDLKNVLFASSLQMHDEKPDLFD